MRRTRRVNFRNAQAAWDAQEAPDLQIYDDRESPAEPEGYEDEDD